MTTMLILIPLTFLLLLVAGGAFFWAVNQDQFEDMDSASLVPLTDQSIAKTGTRTDAEP